MIILIINLKKKDFSDTITNRRKFGYRVETDAYEWVYSAHFYLILIDVHIILFIKNLDMVETPIQRFKRLEKELKELKDDLKDMNNSDLSEDKQAMNFNPVELAQQVESLQNQVNSLHLEAIGAKSGNSLPDNKSKKFNLKFLLIILISNLNFSFTDSFYWIT